MPHMVRLSLPRLNHQIEAEAMADQAHQPSRVERERQARQTAVVFGAELETEQIAGAEVRGRSHVDEPCRFDERVRLGYCVRLGAGAFEMVEDRLARRRRAVT